MAERSHCNCCCHRSMPHNPITSAYSPFPYRPYYPAYPYSPPNTPYPYPHAVGHPQHSYFPMPIGYYPPHPAHSYSGYPPCHIATPPAPEPITKPECSEKFVHIPEKASEKPKNDDNKLLNLKKYGQYRWVPTSTTEDNSFVIKDGLLIGTDVDGSDIYAARAKFSGDMIPGKYKPNKNVCTVTMCAQEASVEDFEVLIPTSFSWVKAMKGAVPPGAVPAGVCANGEKYYYGRVRHDDALIPGKMQPSHGNSYYGIDGDEFSSKEYEILVLSQNI